MNEENNVGVAGDFKTASSGGSFIKSSEFDNGLTVEVVGMNKFTPNDPKYGVKNEYGAGGAVIKEHWFVKNGILAEGESFKYTFLVDGVEKTFDNSSLSFYFVFTKIDPKKGDILSIKRDNTNEKRPEWFITESK
jgi:hypothetical protein